MWFKGLYHVDLFVANPRRMVDALVERLGFQPPDAGLAMAGLKEDGFYDTPNYGAEVAFPRVSPWSLELLEVISMRPVSAEERTHASQTPLNSIYGVLPGAMVWQGNRPVKSHRIHAATAPNEDLLRLVRHWDDTGVPYLFIEPNSTVPVPAIFPGWQGDPIKFDPSQVVLPWEWGTPALLGLMEPAERDHWLSVLQGANVEAPAPSVAAGDTPLGSVRSVVAQSFIVDDLDESMDALAKHMLMSPTADGVVVSTFTTYRRAQYLAEPGGANLELVQPLADGRIARYYAAYGAGPYSVRLGTRSLEACIAELDRRGTRWSADHDLAHGGIVVDPSSLCGAEFEIVEV